MIALVYFVEANLALVASVVVLAALRLLVTAVGGGVSPRTDVLALRGILAMSTVIPVVTLAFESVSGLDAVLLGVTTEFDTVWGTALYWAAGAQTFDMLLPVLMLGSAVAGGSLICLDLRALSRLKSSSRIRRRIGTVLLREGRPDIQPCAFLERRAVTVLVPAGTIIRERRTILYHEAAHIRHRDLQWNWILSFAAVLYAWNPAFWVLTMFHRHQCEVACDRSVISRQKVSLQDYVQTLLGIAVAPAAASEPGTAGSMFLGGKRLQKAGLKRRILCLLKTGEGVHERPLLPVFLVLALLTNVTLATVKIDVQPWSVAALTSATIENLERIAFNKPTRSFGLVLAY